MPLFGSTSNDAQNWEPQAADSRLAHTAGAEPGGVFTSDLSVSEYALLGEAGFEPLGFVVGSSIYHVGLQVGRWSQNAELQTLTQAMYNARELAMARMRAEADHLAADGVVGVSLRMQMYAWGQEVLEFVATGTAVRALGGDGTGTQGAHRAPDGRAFTSDLSAQDFFRLLAAGAVPVAFVLGTCVYHIAHQSAMQSLRQAGRNQEMIQFTQGVYEARELALVRMQTEASQAQASGIVGVNVAVSNHVWGEHATEFLATGTAIRRLSDEHRLPATTPKPTFTLGLDS
ncbi:MAG TPA: heavy metal-binding domain-containing protein [Streptosporangiaceae bacterium]|nr:heavy metal-binding domain-containing protein [Streptosporangiaceae bacterium]